MGENVQTTQASTSLSFFSESLVIKHGKKPLRTKQFVLDLENEVERANLMKEIKNLGGEVVDSYENDDEKPYCIVTDHPSASYLENMQKTKVSSQVLLSLPVMLRNAVQDGIRVRTYRNFCLILNNLKNRLKLQSIAARTPVKRRVDERDDPGIRVLLAPYMKLEDNDQHFCPAFKEFSTPTNFRPIYFGEAAGRSLFHKATPEYIKKKKLESKKNKPRAKSHRGPGFCDICIRECPDLQLHFSCKEHQMHISEPEFYKEVDSLCGSFTKEIVVPNQPLRRRRTPEPLPLPENDLFE